MRWIRNAYEVKAYRWSGSAEAIVYGTWTPEEGTTFKVGSLIPPKQQPTDGPTRWALYLDKPDRTIQPGEYLVGDPLVNCGAWTVRTDAQVKAAYQRLEPPTA